MTYAPYSRGANSPASRIAIRKFEPEINPWSRSIRKPLPDRLRAACQSRAPMRLSDSKRDCPRVISPGMVFRNKGDLHREQFCHPQQGQTPARSSPDREPLRLAVPQIVPRSASEIYAYARAEGCVVLVIVGQGIAEIKIYETDREREAVSQHYGQRVVGVEPVFPGLAEVGIEV